MEPNRLAVANERRQSGASAPEAALSELTSLARDLGIPASTPRAESEVRGLVEQIRERIHTRAMGHARRYQSTLSEGGL